MLSMRKLSHLQAVLQSSALQTVMLHHWLAAAQTSHHLLVLMNQTVHRLARVHFQKAKFRPIPRIDFQLAWCLLQTKKKVSPHFCYWKNSRQINLLNLQKVEAFAQFLKQMEILLSFRLEGMVLKLSVVMLVVLFCSRPRLSLMVL